MTWIAVASPGCSALSIANSESQATAKLFSLSDRIGICRRSPSCMRLYARPSSASSIQASPRDVEKNTSSPRVTILASPRAAQSVT